MQKYMDTKKLPKAAVIGIRSGVQLIVSLLREVCKTNTQLRDDTLDFLMDLFSEVKPLDLWSSAPLYIELDKSLHTVADFLEEVVKNDRNKTSDSTKAKAFKVLLSLALLRGSLPNLLSIVDLIRTMDLNVNV